MQSFIMQSLFPFQNIHELTLKRDVNKLMKIGVLKKINNAQWEAPAFIIPKSNGTVRFVSDFRELNKRIKRKPFTFKIYYLN